MNLWYIAGVLLAFYAVVFLYFKLFSKKNNIIHVRLWEKIGDQVYEVNPNKLIQGKVKVIDNVEKFVLPKKYAPRPIQSPLSSYLQLNTKGMKIVNLMKIGEGIFAPVAFNKIKVDDKTMESKIDILDGSLVFWATQEVRHAEAINKKQDKWAWIKQNIAIVGAMVIAAMIIFGTMNFAKEEMANNRAFAGEQVQQTKTIVERLEGISRAMVGNSADTTPKPTPPKTGESDNG